MITDHSRNLQLQPKDFSFYSKFNSILDYKFNLFVKSICTQLIDIIKKNLINIKKLKDTFYKKNDGSHVSEGDLLIQKLLQNEISTNHNKYFLISEENDHLWLEHHVDKFIEYEKILPENRIAGLIQYEFNESGRYYPGYHSYFDWEYDSVEIHNNKVFAHFNNVHQACFLISSKQLKKISKKHDFTNFMSIKKKYSIKCKVNTEIYEDCGLKNTMLK